MATRRNKKSKGSAEATDAYSNQAARLGFGTPSLTEGSEYPLTRFSNNYQALLSLYREHWLCRRIVEVPAQDMVKAWPTITSELTPDDLKLDQPLDTDTIELGSFRGLIPFDRWSGITPTSGICMDITRPLQFGLPESYQVHGPSTSTSFKVHASRILRFTGPDIPSPEFQAQSFWGISCLEPVFDQ
jgi:hypothetical protein